MPPVTKGHSGQDHVTVSRWVQRYAPEMERCLRLLSAKGDTVAAKRFLAKALAGANHPHPRVINTDKDAGDCATQSRGCFGGELPTSPGAVP